ncbi:hypothetical protein SKZ59_11200 [Janthinobacterium sp. GMG2]|uniref:hypothetical protein n=1 Tax=Janthinobacterium sp. GMG2 TaxID=3096606 RepID=UPI0029F4BCA5|nr:hypothetical protein [Janthinobacterium sp. GMG2]MDX8122344.1 hypothetical protein [Janthinobacterium sp. GMG2]
MIIGEYAACGTCGKNYRLRIQVGLDKIQNHNFHCLKCQESIYVKLAIGDGDNSGIIFGENCLQGTADDATPQYLSSDFFAGVDEVNAPKSMPSLNFMMDVIKKIGINKLNEIKNKKENILTGHQKRPEEIWPTLKKAWRMKRSGQNKLSESMIKKFSKENGYTLTLNLPYFFF